MFVPLLAVLLESCLTLAWVLLESCLTLALVLLESCLILACCFAWVLLQSCFSLVPRLKLAFRGSYFLLLIGSPRPSLRRVPQASLGSNMRFHTRMFTNNYHCLQFSYKTSYVFFTFSLCVFFCIFAQAIIFILKMQLFHRFSEKHNGFWTFLFPSLLSCFSLASVLLQSCFSLASVLFPD